MKKKEFIEAKDWMKKAKKLKDGYKSYDELKQHCMKLFGLEYFALLDHPRMNIILIKPEKYVEGGKPENHITYPPTYKIIENGALKRFNQEVIIDELAPVLAKHVNRVGLIKDVLHEQTPSELKELYDRVIGIEEKKKKPSIKQRPGCTYLAIGGKPGKPLKLMEYLCIITKTPTGGIVLDPFIGSGTTAIACKLTGRQFIGFENNAEYYKIAQARLSADIKKYKVHIDKKLIKDDEIEDELPEKDFSTRLDDWI